MKKILFILVLLTFVVSGLAQTETRIALEDFGVKVDPDKRVTAVLTALEVAGVKTNLGEEGEALRKQIKEDFANIDPSLQARLTLFAEQYDRRNANKSDAERLSSYISMAYSLSQVPELNAPERSLDLPDNLLEVLDFADLVKELYSTPGAAAKIDGYFKKEIKQSNEIAPSTRAMVLNVLDYLHTKPELIYVVKTVSKGTKGKTKGKKVVETKSYDRTFTVVPSSLIPSGTVVFLNVNEDYVVAVAPDTDLSQSQARRAYLQYVLDPLVLRNATKVFSKGKEIKELISKRRESDPSISPDVLLAVSRSLVAAADAREEEYRKVNIATAQARNKLDVLKDDAEKRATVAELQRLKQIFSDETALQLSESYENGAVLSFFFADKLRGIEDSGFDISNSIGVWIEDLDPSKEGSRLKEFAEARNRATEARKNRRTVIETTLISNPLTEALLVIDKEIESKNFAKAESELQELIAQFPKGAARIYYSLGRNASKSAEGVADQNEVNRRLLKAKEYFEKTLSIEGTDRELLSLAYVSLGRIYEFYNQDDYAVRIYDAAMKVGKADGDGFKRAFEAKKRLVQN